MSYGVRRQPRSPKKDYDAIVVGAGPNGLAAAITLQQAGLSVLLVEGSNTIGGGLRSAELTLPGFVHDVCSAIHPLAVASPFLSSLPLRQYGLEYIHPDVAVAHPFDDGTAATLVSSVEQTARLLGTDEQAYLNLMQPIVRNWPLLVPDILAPLHVPAHPVAMAGFGLKAVTSALRLSERFRTTAARGLWAGMAAHSVQPLSHLTTSAPGLVLMAAGHAGGWPLVKGGSQQMADALAAYFVASGGKIATGFYIHALKDLPSCEAILFDITPRQLLKIAGHRFSPLYRWQLNRYRYGPGVFKMDFALDAPIPFTAEPCTRAGTVHIGNTIKEISFSEREAWRGRHTEKPYLLLAQQSLFDASRAPAGKHTAWAYCHVPNGSQTDMSAVIENQIERFAPGFKERILARHTMNTAAMEAYNPNYIGGDIGGGAIDLAQLFTRPALRWSPYRTSAKGLYLCSSSTPPGGGVHGMCGYHAAKRVLKDQFPDNL